MLTPFHIALPSGTLSCRNVHEFCTFLSSSAWDEAMLSGTTHLCLPANSTICAHGDGSRSVVSTRLAARASCASFASFCFFLLLVLLSASFCFCTRLSYSGVSKAQAKRARNLAFQKHKQSVPKIWRFKSTSKACPKSGVSRAQAKRARNLAFQKHKQSVPKIWRFARTSKAGPTSVCARRRTRIATNSMNLRHSRDSAAFAKS